MAESSGLGREPVRILPLSAVAQEDRVIAAVERIFFAASNRQTFDNAAEQAAFRERWLGRYLDRDAAHCFVAVVAARDDEAEPVIGYLAGSLDNPAAAPRFDDIAYFKIFAAQCAAFPAHLHVNLDAAWRGHGIGAQLVDAFADHAAAAGASGIHVVISPDARNRRFYERIGFEVRGETMWNGHRVVFLGRLSAA